MALHDNYLGPNNTDNLAAEAEAELMRLRYTGEKRRHNYDSYVNAHKRLHNVYNDLKEHGHEGISEQTKVRKFTSGIHNRHLAFLKGQVLASPALRHNFEAVVTLYRDYISQSKALFTESDGMGVQVGAVATSATSGNKRKVHDTNWDTSDVEVELRHYSPDEYKRLTGPQKLKLKRWRANGHSAGDLKSKMLNPDHPTMKKMIAMMQTASVSNSKKPGRVNQSKAAKAKQKAAQKPGNRNNSALVKQVACANADDDDADE
jgi:hypothetical protein